MKKNRLFGLLLFLLVTNNMCAQLGKAVREILTGDSVATRTAVRNDSDSVRMADMRKELEEARLSEANMRMEMEQMRLKAFAADSVKLAQQRARIDSLRQFTPGVPVVVEGDTLFYLYTKRGGYTPLQRAEMIDAAIMQLGKRFTLHPDSVYIESSDIVTDLMYGNKVIASFTDQDGLWEGRSREQLATDKRKIVVQKLKELKEEHSLWQLGKRILYFVLVLAGQYLLFWLTGWLFRKLKVRIQKLKDTRLKPISIQNYELLDTQRQVNLLIFLSNLLRYVIMLLQLLITVPLLFAIFPQTKGLAYQIFSYIWNPIKNILVGIVDYIPNLFAILIICFAVKYLVRLVHYLSREVEAGRLKFGGFYPDWAMPTYHIIRFLLYAFMIAMIYPYLPGAKNGVFQGISVFVGLIISLGSSTVIGNVIAGLVITYMRPFKLGDRIQLNDTTGNVIEKTPLVTRIKTPKNEVVTIPNSFIMSSHTVNYSASAREYGLIIHSEVTIGYDVPWRQVHQLLIEAALNTPGVIDDPRPFVLETSLSDWYPVYQINAYIREADKLAQIYSDLHQNIQDRFNEAGIEIMSPHYMAMRDGNESTIPKDDLRPKTDK
ncbi:mechanosensitive ion channel family protein [Bacteroides fragilis]|uniref:mechanosensitive ion channel family protein n=1 Tax=Bacteroides fragilis TaxID=817 RepID=UPI000451197A|nr:mechanosensitive ion channel family protein [Bacteroides fragilis]EXZ87018.1 mechanosensitive ion channel family protein [Bacteroides fragilis str. J38-1]KAA4739524.1 mechanosensitive ion channel family protein [Bacteroides fragilis]KAA4757836.1 mechanosensitive ion channel family protein [Bacteroides fragilis]KAA4760351.1 mechanosensitive ion channel family protein [Bacteroides fragilis]KAA4761947.1 mechanosensitive ion channel family protein [Bacteroides fragilis]